jgi:NADPH-dependent glutamate synthase beta subunit-like oxidoreductase
VLKTHGVPTRKNYVPPALQIIEELETAPAESLSWLPATTPLTVTTDANGTVERIERVRPTMKTYVWEVRFESAMRLEAATITEAIREVEKLPMCRRVFGVALKGAP